MRQSPHDLGDAQLHFRTTGVVFSPDPPVELVVSEQGQRFLPVLRAFSALSNLLYE